MQDKLNEMSTRVFQFWVQYRGSSEVTTLELELSHFELEEYTGKWRVPDCLPLLSAAGKIKGGPLNLLLRELGKTSKHITSISVIDLGEKPCPPTSAEGSTTVQESSDASGSSTLSERQQDSTLASLLTKASPAITSLGLNPTTSLPRSKDV